MDYIKVTNNQFDSLKIAIDEHKELIEKTFDNHRSVIKENTDGIADLKNKVDPIYDIVIEFKGFSRFAGRIKVIVLWFIGVGAAIVSGYEYLQHLNDKG